MKGRTATPAEIHDWFARMSRAQRAVDDLGAGDEDRAGWRVLRVEPHELNIVIVGGARLYLQLRAGRLDVELEVDGASERLGVELPEAAVAYVTSSLLGTGPAVGPGAIASPEDRARTTNAHARGSQHGPKTHGRE